MKAPGPALRTPTLRFVRENARWLAAGALLTFTSSYGQTFFISIFAGEIQAEFGLSHGAWGTIYAGGTFASAVAMLWAGGLTDRFRVRALARAILPGFALACLAMALVPGVWALPAIVFALRFAGQGMVSHIAVVAMARWFVATRGRALSIAAFGFALGEATLPLIFVALLGTVDWRVLWVVAAALILATWPVVERLLTQERTPNHDLEDMGTAGMAGRHWRRAEVLRHPLFWFLVPVLMGPSAFGTAYFFHQVHFAATKEMSHLALVALFPLFTAVAVTAMLGSGFVIDRVGTARLMPVYQVPIALAFVLLSLSGGALGVALGMAVMAVTVGANHTLTGAFWAEFYGTRHLGSVKAMATAVTVLGTAIGPILTGVLIDYGLSFDRQMLGIGAYFAVACVLAGIGIGRAAGTLPPRAAEVDVVRP